MKRLWLLLAVVLVCAGCGEEKWEGTKTTVHSASNESVDVSGHIVEVLYQCEDGLDYLMFTDYSYIRARGLANAYPFLRMEAAMTTICIERRDNDEWWFVPLVSGIHITNQTTKTRAPDEVLP